MADPSDVLAERVKRALSAAFGAADVCDPPEVSGPGFVNFRLRDDWIAAQAQEISADDRLGVARAERPQNIVVEYSSPNVAKEMHVGHLRTTIVGDAIARVLEFVGHRVTRDNHLGDWGTPFGMLIEHLLDVGETSAEADLLKTDPNSFYQAARRKFDTDPEFAKRSRERVVWLQDRDPDTIRLWEELVALSREYLRRTYARLGVTLTDDDIRGESFYRDMLDAVARQAGWIPAGVRFEHAQIGNVLGADGKLLRTRAGGTIKLSQLLDEAVERADSVIADRYEHAELRRQIAEVVGIGGVKYADLAVARESSYVFDFDRMLALNGNTGPYLQYAVARIRSIFRKAARDPAQAAGPISFTDPAERALGLRLLGFGAAAQQVADAAEPHRLCAYLFDVASSFTTFYEQCPVIGAPSAAVKESRLALSALALRVLLAGLGLLGVRVPDRM